MLPVARRVLVVDDNEGLTKLLSKLIARLGGHQVESWSEYLDGQCVGNCSVCMQRVISERPGVTAREQHRAALVRRLGRAVAHLGELDVRHHLGAPPEAGEEEDGEDSAHDGVPP